MSSSSKSSYQLFSILTPLDWASKQALVASSCSRCQQQLSLFVRPTRCQLCIDQVYCEACSTSTMEIIVSIGNDENQRIQKQVSISCCKSETCREKISSKNIIFTIPFNNNSLATENEFLLIDSITNELCNKPKLEETLLLRMFQDSIMYPVAHDDKSSWEQYLNILLKRSSSSQASESKIFISSFLAELPFFLVAKLISHHKSDKEKMIESVIKILNVFQDSSRVAIGHSAFQQIAFRFLTILIPILMVLNENLNLDQNNTDDNKNNQNDDDDDHVDSKTNTNNDKKDDSDQEIFTELTSCLEDTNEFMQQLIIIPTSSATESDVEDRFHSWVHHQRKLVPVENLVDSLAAIHRSIDFFILNANFFGKQKQNALADLIQEFTQDEYNLWSESELRDSVMKEFEGAMSFLEKKKKKEEGGCGHGDDEENRNGNEESFSFLSHQIQLMFDEKHQEENSVARYSPRADDDQDQQRKHPLEPVSSKESVVAASATTATTTTKKKKKIGLCCGSCVIC
jgi:hypothetical protein